MTREAWFPRSEIRGAVVVAVVMAAAGALLGVLWQWWSPPGPLAVVLPNKLIQPDESEAFIAADGRYAVLTAAAGLLAAVIVWLRRDLRGPGAALALGAGGLAGALLTDVVGRALDNGKSGGPADTVINHLRLQVHLHGLRLLEPLVAILAYSLCVAFAARDDLGGESVERVWQPEHGWRDGDAAGVVQQP
ncbi:MAG TPA: DUF2567 domain-containing protein [Jatrophihabitantaceae bacterium]|nr:DUF2567 domain-containing protein [Jatrophihabitantaceae bacterium]